MMHCKLALAAVLVLAAAAVGSSALAQDDTNRLSTTDLAEPEIFSFPEHGNIVIQFGRSKQVYFKERIKSVRLDDELLVKARPITDHVVRFEGLSPGRTEVVIETEAGQEERIAMVTVVREFHEVRIYKNEGKDTGIRGNNVTILNSTISPETSREASDYVSVLCNELGCVMPRRPK